MIDRLYVHNYRCLENFTLDLKGQHSALILGKNGAGKFTALESLRLIQMISRGAGRVREIITESDFIDSCAANRRFCSSRYTKNVKIPREKWRYSDVPNSGCGG